METGENTSTTKRKIVNHLSKKRGNLFGSLSPYSRLKNDTQTALRKFLSFNYLWKRGFLDYNIISRKNSVNKFGGKHGDKNLARVKN